GGERVSVSPALALQTLYVGSNLPNDQTCTVGGTSFLYQFNIATGYSDALFLGNVLLEGLTIVQLTTGANAGTIVGITVGSDGKADGHSSTTPPPTGSLHRTSWRELVE